MKNYTNKITYQEVELWLAKGEEIEVSSKDFPVLKEIAQDWVREQDWFEGWELHQGKYKGKFKIIIKEQ